MTAWKWKNVLDGDWRYSLDCARAEDLLASLPDKCVDLCFFSPPYSLQRTYGIGFDKGGERWVEWMRVIVREACRVTNGLVCVNAVGPVEDGCYQPIMECLVADLTRLDGLVCGPAPWCWWKVCGIPGSGGPRYQRRDWEPVYAFADPKVIPLKWTDNTAGGHPPKYGPGGEMSYRGVDGVRRNAMGFTPAKSGQRREDGERREHKTRRHTKRVPAGDGDVMREQVYTPPALSNPGNVIQIPESDRTGGSVVEARVGGGHLGSKLAHQNEAPMPKKLADRFVRWYARPGGVVLDMFAGSGTTIDAALDAGRRAIGGDVRESQVALAHRRIMGQTLSLFGDFEDTDSEPDTPAPVQVSLCETNA